MNDLPSSQGKTLVLFLSPSSFYAFSIEAEVSDCLQIGAHFCIAPLLPFLHKHSECYILAVSKKHARLLHLHSDGLAEIDAEGLPHSFDEEFANLEHQDKELQSHAGGGGGGGHAMFHGQGGASDMNKEELEQYLHKIAKAVDHTLQGQHAPLLFIGIEEEFGMLRKHLSYAQLADQPLPGNPDVLSGEDIANRAVAALNPLWKKEREVALEVYGPLSGTGRTSVDTQAILDLSYHGKVDGLLLSEGLVLWGKVHADSGIAELHDRQEQGDIELSGMAAIHTLQHKGWVRVLSPEQMPEGAKMAAVLRY